MKISEVSKNFKSETVVRKVCRIPVLLFLILHVENFICNIRKYLLATHEVAMSNRFSDDGQSGTIKQFHEVSGPKGH
jgi:hypothetical protein